MATMIESAKNVMRRLAHHGEVYMVGGAVRDLIMGNPVNDVDIATNVPMSIIESLFPSHDIGKNKDFGIVVVEQDGFSFEVAQFRADVYDSVAGKGASSVNIVNDLKADVARRDFTINGLAMNIDDGVIDHVGGAIDIKNKVIRAIGSPNDRFAEDYIRMLRAVRFATRFGFSLDPDTANAIWGLAENIESVPAERIMKEILKMAEQPGWKFADGIELMKSLDLIDYVFPEVFLMDSLPQSPEHHPEGNVYQHSISALRQYDGEDPVVNMCILFHDIGKLTTHSVDEDGIHHYYNHSNSCTPLVDALANRMKFDNNLRSAMHLCASKHMRFHFLGREKERKILELMHDPHFDVLYKVAECDTKSRKEAFREEDWLYVPRIINKIRAKYGSDDPLSVLKKAVSGDLVMATCGFKKPCKEVGDMINKTIDYIIKNGTDFRDENEIRKVLNLV